MPPKAYTGLLGQNTVWARLFLGVLNVFVAFPNRKSIIFDNKLDFSGIKLAES